MLTLEVKGKTLQEQADEIIEFAKDSGIFNTLWKTLEHHGKRDEAAFFLDAYICDNDAYIENDSGELFVDLSKLVDDDSFLEDTLIFHGELFDDTKSPYYLLDQIVDKYEYFGGKYYQEDNDNWYEAVRDCFT